MGTVNDILSFDRKKTFVHAAWFYIIHLVLSFAVSFAIEFLWFAILFNESSHITDEKMVIVAKVLPAAYALVLSVLILRAKGFKVNYINFALLGSLVTYTLSVPLGMLFIAYLTTVGDGKLAGSKTLI